MASEDQCSRKKVSAEAAMLPCANILLELLRGGHAHADFDAAVKNLPAALRGKRPKGAEHSPWEILEHLRIAQWDILEFSRNPNINHPTGPTATGRRRRRLPMKRHGTRACAPSAATSRRCAISSPIQRPISTRRFPTARGRPSCEKRCSSPTTMPIISASWCWCAGCWARGM